LHRPRFRSVALIQLGELREPECGETSIDKHRYPLPELVLTLLPRIWPHGRRFGGGPE
jgi:hypothetical protein